MISSVLITRAAGLIILIIGLIIVVNPELVTNKPVPEDTFEAIERRIWWGLLIGAGLLLLFNHQWTPWLPTVLITVVALITGLLAARLIGILLDGSVIKQWYLVIVELVIAAPFLWWYLRIRH
jgi:hypothetical protein